MRRKADLILSGDYPASSLSPLSAKDAQLIAEAAERANKRMDLAAAAAERFRRAEAQGHGGEDGAAVYFASFADGE